MRLFVLGLRQGGFLCALCAGIASAQSSTSPDSLTTLTPAEAQALGLDSASSPLDSPLPVQEIRVLGIPSHAVPFLKTLLPVHTHQILSRTELEAKLSAFNQRIAGRLDLYQSCVAMFRQEDTGWLVLVQVVRRDFWSYNGGNAWVYFGHPSRTTVGDRWGTWVGLNRIGGHIDQAIAPGMFLGGHLEAHSPLDQDAPDHDLRHFQAGAVARQILSPTAQWECEVGLRAVQANAAHRLPEGNPLALTIHPTLELDHTWALHAIGIGGFTTFDALIGQNLSNKQRFASFRVQGQIRSGTVLRTSLCGKLDLEHLANRQSYQPALLGSFGTREAQHQDSMLTQSITATIQPRLSLWNGPLAFTSIDAGIHGQLEFYQALGATRSAGITQAAGIHAAIASPVNVDFQLDAGQENARFLGLRFSTQRAF